MNLEKLLTIDDEVQNALQEGKPVVALESTIISHGFPYPDNVILAKEVAKIIREQGAIPATTAIINGKLKVGLNEHELEYLADKKNQIIKASRRDIPYLVSQGLSGATTVAATMIVANMVGIKVFATGGIGGVHRGAEVTFDISADLEELAETSVCVVCAGFKSILNLGLTLEYMETKGVPVIGYKTKKLPAFYVNTSEFDVPITLDSAQEIATLLETKQRLGLKGGTIVANPIPKEHSLASEFINTLINDAVNSAKDSNISGKAVTAFILQKLTCLTEGKSVAANIALMHNNAKLAAKIARVLSE